jgi:hypothetical protein
LSSSNPPPRTSWVAPERWQLESRATLRNSRMKMQSNCNWKTRSARRPTAAFFSPPRIGQTYRPTTVRRRPTSTRSSGTTTLSKGWRTASLTTTTKITEDSFRV